MTIRPALFWMAVGGALTFAALALSQHRITVSPSTGRTLPAVSTRRITAASPGRVEGASEPIEVGPAADGVIQSVLVTEGQYVRRGTLLAKIGCGDIEAEIRQSAAEQEAAEQRLKRLFAGSRPEERELAAQKIETARAVLREAARYYDRIQPLAEKDEVSQSMLDKARRDFEVAQSQVEEAVRNQHLVDGPPRVEDVARAEAEVRAAVERGRVNQERVAKCMVRAPISGTITRIFAQPGESFSTANPRSLLTISDVSVRRIRAQVDERDISGIMIGQAVEITVDAYPNRTFKGTVAQIYMALGRKTIVTGDPSEKTDRDVLEVLIRLQTDGNILPLGLRVGVQFLSPAVS